MTTGCYIEILNHYMVHLKLILHCMLTNWNLKLKTLMLNIAPYQGNTNQNHTQISPHGQSEWPK